MLEAIFARFRTFFSSESPPKKNSSPPAVVEEFETKTIERTATPVRGRVSKTPPPPVEILKISFVAELTWKLGNEEEKKILRQLQHLFDQEGQIIALVSEDRWYLKHRKTLVDFMTTFGDEDRSLETVFLAVFLQDRVLHAYQLEENKLKLVSFACLLISAKFVGDTCFQHKILEDSQKLYTKRILLQMEMEVLKYFNYSINFPTSLLFFKEFLKISFAFDKKILINDCVVEGEPVKVAWAHLEKYGEFFLELCLEEYGFNQYPQSMMAASAILCSRRALKITPEWANHLSHFTTYKEEELKRCSTRMWEYYKELFPGHLSITGAATGKAEVSGEDIFKTMFH